MGYLVRRYYSMKIDKTAFIDPPEIITHSAFTTPAECQCDACCTKVIAKFIITTEDKIKLYLLEFQKNYERKTQWATSLGIFLTLIAALVTAEFKIFLGISAETWYAVFIICSVVSFGIMVLSLLHTFRRRQNSTVEYVVKKIIDSSTELHIQETIKVGN